MSEAERKRRLRYIKNRKKLIFTQAIAIVIMALILVGSLLTYNNLNKTYYIDYTENSVVDYKVQLKPNEFYEEEWQPGGKSYISGLISSFEAEFDYRLNMAVKDVNYDYSYRIDAVYSVIDRDSGQSIIEKSVPLSEAVRLSQSSNNQLNINKTVAVDYESYNDYVVGFIDAYDLRNVKADLNVIMTVDVIGSSNEFQSDAENRYTAALHIPLATQTVNAEYKSSVANGEGKVLACKNTVGLDVLRIVSMVSATLAVVLSVLLVAFVFLTKNHDVNYTNKVQRLYSAYRSFIQKITNGFDTTGYQILMLDSFNDMLAIRDTIQSPVLMSENTDKTRTQFFIPTNTKILYAFDIKVDNYDELYSIPGYFDDSVVKIEPVVSPAEDAMTIEQASTVFEEEIPVMEGAPATEVTPIIEEAIITEETATLPVETAVQEIQSEEIIEDAIDSDTLEDEVLVETDELGNKIVIHFSRSVSARVIQCSDIIKRFYSELKNYILSYKGVKCRTSWKYESYNKGRKQLLKLKLRGKTLLMYCALDPNNYEYKKFFHEIAEAKAYSAVPMLVRIKSERALKRAKRLVDDIMANNEIQRNPKAEFVDYVELNPYETTRALIDRELIKVLSKEAVIPDESESVPAASLESAPIDEESIVFESGVGEAVLDTDSELNLDSDEGDESWQSSGIKINRSFAAKLIQLDAEEKADYSELKNYFLSFKGVKARTSWKCETYKRGKDQLAKLKIRGKMLLVYLAIDPASADYSSYNYEITDSKAYERVPFTVKVRGDRGLSRAKALVDVVMNRFGILKNDKAQTIDYAAENPHESSEALMDKGLLKIIIDDKEVKINDRCGFTVSAIVKAIISEDKDLREVDFVDKPDPEYAGKDAVDVVSVVIPDKDNNIYRYDPEGESYSRGDKLLVPTTSASGAKKVVRRATVTEGNHKVDAKKLGNPVGKVIGVVKRVLENLLSK